MLPEAEKVKVLKFHFPRDAALSLASCLLKHFAITVICNIPWRDSAVSQEKTVLNGKPYYAAGGIEFNVSHHGEAAVLVATQQQDMRVGIDLSMVDPARDGRTIARSGFEGWVRIFAEVFSEREVQNILRSNPRAASATPAETQRGMRAFYSHWALKEAYFKMTGDSLLASWLKELEFSGVVPPEAAEGAGSDAARRWAKGGTTHAAASLRGNRQEACQLELMALGQHYIVATATTSPCLLPPFELVDVASRILPLASAA